MALNKEGLIELRLRQILQNLQEQRTVGESYVRGTLSFDDEIAQITEFLDVGETGLAYETLVSTIQLHPFVLSHIAVIALLESGLLLGFKTDRPEDRLFDRR